MLTKYNIALCCHILILENPCLTVCPYHSEIEGKPGRESNPRHARIARFLHEHPNGCVGGHLNSVVFYEFGLILSKDEFSSKWLISALLKSNSNIILVKF